MNSISADTNQSTILGQSDKATSNCNHLQPNTIIWASVKSTMLSAIFISHHLVLPWQLQPVKVPCKVLAITWTLHYKYKPLAHSKILSTSCQLSPPLNIGQSNRHGEHHATVHIQCFFGKRNFETWNPWIYLIYIVTQIKYVLQQKSKMHLCLNQQNIDTQQDTWNSNGRK